MIVPPELASMVAGNINPKVVTDQWSELLRLALSIETGTVTTSVILRKIAAYPRQNGFALALSPAVHPVYKVGSLHKPVHSKSECPIQ